MKRLYRIDVTYYVMAESREEAQMVRPDFGIEEALSDASIEETLSVSSSWRDAIPFGGDDDRTCGEILEAQGKGEEGRL